MGAPISVETIERATLTPVVRKALRSDTAEVTDWECPPIYGGSGLIAGIFRFAGYARDQGRDVPWSLILKSINIAEAHQDPTHFRYGLREVFAYRSGLLDDLPGGLAAPVCYGTEQPSDELFWIWLEEITEGVDVAWSLDNYGYAARHLGQFNGAYLAGTPLPAYRWLTHQWLHQWVRDDVTPPRQQLQSHRDHPIARRLAPPDIAEGMTRLWNDLHPFLDALERLPQTLCHLDAYNRNLFPAHPARTVAIDWADMGIAAVGEEMSGFVPNSLLWFGAELADAHELDQTAFAGYLDGLADAGWRGDPRLARFGYVASAALRWGFTGSPDFVINNGALVEQWMRRPLDEVIDRIIGLRRFLLELADEARALLPVIP